MIGVVLMREEKAISGEKKKILQVTPHCAASKSLLYFSWWSILDVTELSYQKEAS